MPVLPGARTPGFGCRAKPATKNSTVVKRPSEASVPVRSNATADRGSAPRRIGPASRTIRFIGLLQTIRLGLKPLEQFQGRRIQAGKGRTGSKQIGPEVRGPSAAKAGPVRSPFGAPEDLPFQNGYTYSGPALGPTESGASRLRENATKSPETRNPAQSWVSFGRQL